MNLSTGSDITLCSFDVLSGVRHVVSTRAGGVSPPPFDALNVSFQVDDDPANVRENRKRFAGAAGFRMEDVVATRQVHGNVVRIVDRTHRGIGAEASADESWACDGLVTAEPNVPLMGFAADCPLVLLASGDGKVVGIAHAGWRPLVGGILRNTVAAMRTLGVDAGRIAAGIAPSIGPCCYEVGGEVKSAAETGIGGVDAFFEPHRDRWLMDLWGLCRKALIDCGVSDDLIEAGGLCSRCRQDLFYSHRGSGGRTGRYAAAVETRNSKLESMAEDLIS